MLVTTQTANKLIADVWFARADFAKDHPGICEGLVRGIFDGMDDLQDRRQPQAGRRADGRGLRHPAGRRARHARRCPQHQLGRELPVLREPEQPDQLRSASGTRRTTSIAAIRTITEPDGAVRPGDGLTRSSRSSARKRSTRSQKDEYTVQLRTPKDVGRRSEAEDEILTNTVVIHFFPNSWDLYKKITKDEDGKTVEELYDPKVDFVLEEIGKLAGSSATPASSSKATPTAR